LAGTRNTHQASNALDVHTFNKLAHLDVKANVYITCAEMCRNTALASNGLNAKRNRLLGGPAHNWGYCKAASDCRAVASFSYIRTRCDGLQVSRTCDRRCSVHSKNQGIRIWCSVAWSRYVWQTDLSGSTDSSQQAFAACRPFSCEPASR
jgi:hypothetical protein